MVKKTMTAFFVILIAGCQTAVPSSAATQAAPPTPIVNQLSPSAPSMTKTSPTLDTAKTQETVKPVYIMAFCTLMGKNPETIVPAGAPIVITWGWEAKTETQLKDFIDNNLTTIKLDGNTLEGKVNPQVKVNQKSGQPETAWYSEVGILDPGKHLLTYDVKLKKMVDDGSTTYGPGGKIESLHDECQITVR